MLDVSMSKRSIRLFLVILSLLILVGLAWRLVSHGISSEAPAGTASTNSLPNQVVPDLSTASLPQEQPITVIPLTGPAAESISEISGMAWYNDNLILLPQYPSRFGSGEGAVFSLSKEDILAFLDNTQSTPLTPIEIPFVAPDIDQIDGFQGFEAIAFSGDHVYMTIEANPSKMMGYLVIGTITPI
jgi:hypothetical protein